MKNIGIIGLGDMGKLFAKGLANKGFCVRGIDLPENTNRLRKELSDSDIIVTQDSAEVVKNSELLLFAVETKNLVSTVNSVAQIIPPNTIVGGLTSVKTPEIAIFEKYLKPQTPIITFHPMHGPAVDSQNQPAVLINHRGTDVQELYVKKVLKALEYSILPVSSAVEHDILTANVQAVTHLGFQSMGTAWMRAGFFPWMHNSYSNQIDAVKYLMMLRIFSGKPHVYSGIAFENPQAQTQIIQYQKSCEKFISLIEDRRESEMHKYLYDIRDSLFTKQTKPLLIFNEELEARINLHNAPHDALPNSHLSLLAMADTWHSMGINPYEHMICQTPPFRMRLGLVERLFADNELLKLATKSSQLYPALLKHDRLFCDSVNSWANCIFNKDEKQYNHIFAQTQLFFTSHLDEGKERSSNLLKYVTD